MSSNAEVSAFNKWVTNYSLPLELVEILKSNGYDSLLSISLLKEDDVKSFKISPGASKKLILAAQQIADKVVDMKNNRKSVYQLPKQYLEAQLEVGSKLENNPFSPGTVSTPDGYILCVEPLQPGVDIPAYFTCIPGGREITFNLVNNNKQTPSDFTIVAILSPTGKRYNGIPEGIKVTGDYSFAGPSGNIVSMGITQSLFELGLWQVVVTPYKKPEENISDKNQVEKNS